LRQRTFWLLRRLLRVRLPPDALPVNRSAAHVKKPVSSVLPAPVIQAVAGGR